MKLLFEPLDEERCGGEVRRERRVANVTDPQQRRVIGLVWLGSSGSRRKTIPSSFPAATSEPIIRSPSSGPDSLRSTLRSVSSTSRCPVVPVAISSSVRSCSSCARANSRRSGFFASWAISATRVIPGPSTPRKISARSRRPSISGQNSSTWGRTSSSSVHADRSCVTRCQ